MIVAPGTRLGVYEVVAAIGAGGMGEVYRARDTRLQRDVAIKILPEVLRRIPNYQFPTPNHSQFSSLQCVGLLAVGRWKWLAVGVGSWELFG
jgi:serine/threonine protein kinase